MNYKDDPNRVDPPECYISRLSDHLTEPDDDYRESQRIARTDPELYAPMTKEDIQAALYDIEQRQKHNDEVDAIVKHNERRFKNYYKIKGLK
tara:strand:- start:1269 stop:1544 length:276 start_codon:yes stop_codon:yes gene_type:complete